MIEPMEENGVVGNGEHTVEAYESRKGGSFTHS